MNTEDWDMSEWNEAMDNCRQSMEELNLSIEAGFAVEYATHLIAKGYDLMPVSMVDEFVNDLKQKIEELLPDAINNNGSQINYILMDACKEFEEKLRQYIVGIPLYKTGNLSRSAQVNIIK